MDKYVSLAKVAHDYGFSESFVRSACHRDAGRHPLPHVRCGKSKGYVRVRPSVFEQWAKEEEMLTVGAVQ